MVPGGRAAQSQRRGDPHLVQVRGAAPGERGTAGVWSVAVTRFLVIIDLEVLARHRRKEVASRQRCAVHAAFELCSPL